MPSKIKNLIASPPHRCLPLMPVANSRDVSSTQKAQGTERHDDLRIQSQSKIIQQVFATGSLRTSPTYPELHHSKKPTASLQQALASTRSRQTIQPGEARRASASSETAEHKTQLGVERHSERRSVHRTSGTSGQCKPPPFNLNLSGIAALLSQLWRDNNPNH